MAGCSPRGRPPGIAGPLIINGFLDAQGKPGELVAADYRPALFTMVGVLAIGFVANLLIRPVAERFHEPAEHTDAFAEATENESSAAPSPYAGSPTGWR